MSARLMVAALSGWLVLASLGLLWSKCAMAQPPSALPPAEKDRPVEPSTLLVRIVKPAKYIGEPAVCPGTSPEEDQTGSLCMAELYEAQARVLRRLGGADTPSRLTIRFTAHSFHAVWRKDVRFIVVVTPFEDKGSSGHFAQRWEWENAAGMFCADRESLARETWKPLKGLYATRPFKRVVRDSDQWAAGSEISCVTGREQLSSSPKK